MTSSGGVAIITGGGGPGSGRAIARRFARAGVSVVVCDVDEPAALETVRVIHAENGTAILVTADVTVESDVRELFESAWAVDERIDVIVNNASEDPAELGPLEDWSRTLAADLIGPMHVTRLGIEAMRRSGGGAIVNIASVSALPHGGGHSPWPAYDIAKAAVIRMTTTLGWLESEGIRVNCLVPGWIASPPVVAFVGSLSPEQRELRGVPKHIYSPDEIAEAVYQLASNDAWAGRVLLLRNDDAPALIATGDRGYAELEPIALDLAPRH